MQAATRRVPRGAEGLGLVAVVAVALAVRLIGLRAGLPGSLLSPDETTVVTRATGMLAHGSPDPGWFLYPSLDLYLIAGAVAVARPFLSWPAGIGFASPAALAHDPTPYVLAGRIVSLVAGVVLAVACWLLGRRAGGPVAAPVAGAIAALSPLTVRYSHLAVTDMLMTALLALALWQLAVALEDRSWPACRRAALLVGLATSAKYNAGLAAVALLAVAWWLAPRGGRLRRRPRRPATAAALALAAFLAGTPFALLDAPRFLSDFADQNRIVADGWLGFENDPPGWVVSLHPILTGALGWAGLVAALAAIALALARRSRVDLLLAPFSLGYVAYVSTWSAHFDRYLLPVVPPLAALVGRLVAEVAAVRLRRPAGAGAAAVLAAGLLAAPAASTAGLLRGYGRPDRLLAAAERLPATIPPGATIVTDPLGLPLVDRAEGLALDAAGARTPWYALVRLATPQPGRPSDPLRSLPRLRADGYRWLITSDDIQARVLAAASRHPLEARFYRALGRLRPVLRVPAGLRPGVRVYDLWRGGTPRHGVRRGVR